MTLGVATFIRIVREPQLLRLYVTSEGTPQVSAPLIHFPQFALRTSRTRRERKESLGYTRQPRRISEGARGLQIKPDGEIAPIVQPALYKGGLRSATLAVPLFLTLVLYSFTMRVKCL